MVMNANAGGGMMQADDDDEENGQRDWLDYIYMAVRIFMLMSIFWFYSSAERLIVMGLVMVIVWLIQSGMFNLNRAPRNRQQGKYIAKGECVLMSCGNHRNFKCELALKLKLLIISNTFLSTQMHLYAAKSCKLLKTACNSVGITLFQVVINIIWHCCTWLQADSGWTIFFSVVENWE